MLDENQLSGERPQPKPVMGYFKFRKGNDEIEIQGELNWVEKQIPTFLGLFTKQVQKGRK